MNIKLFLSFSFCFFVTSVVFSQQKVEGVVTSSKDNLPLPGVSVLIENSNRGTMTGYDGDFVLETSPKDVLLFSYIGFKTKRVVVGDQIKIDVSLEEEISSLDEVVVIGYGTSNKKDLTGSIESVKTEDILETKTANFVNGLQGRVSGVQITSGSGAPGSDVNIKIRGSSSINTGNQPLYVIDGVQFDPNDNSVAQSSYGDDGVSPLSFLSASDIKDMQILKDASATAIYGARGANGVVIITTKSGTKGASNLYLNVFTSVSKIFDSNRTAVLNTVDFGDWFRYWDQTSSFYYEEDANGILIPRDLSNKESNNWQKELSRVAFTRSADLGFSNSTEQGNLSGSMSISDQEGVLKNTNFYRLTGRLKGETKFNTKTKIGGVLNVSSAVTDGVSEGGLQGARAGATKSIVLFKPVDPNINDDPNNADEDLLSRPTSFVLESERQNRITRLLGNIYINHQFNEVLSLKSSFGGNISNSKLKEFYPSSVLQGGLGTANSVISTVSSNTWSQENVFTFDKKFNKNHRLNATFVLEARSNKFETLTAGNTNFEYEGTGADDIGAGSSPTIPTSSSVTFNNFSTLLRANYFLKRGTYLFTTSIRADGSSKFSPENQWGYFPSVAFAWRISKENFLKESNVINDLKLRTSYGLTGNDRLTPFQYLPFFSSTLGVTDNAYVTAYKPAVLGNNDLTWETSAQYNIGIDLTAFNSRLNFTADIYKKITNDMLFLNIVPSTTGFKEQWQNIGRIDNQGVELALSGDIISTDNINWYASANVNLQNSEIKSLGELKTVNINFGGVTEELKGRLQVGESIGSFFGYEFGGIYQYKHFQEFQGLTNEEAAAIYNPNTTYTLLPNAPVKHSAQVSAKPGDQYYKDLNNDGIVDDVNDKTILGSSLPDIYGGFSTGLKVRNLDFNMNFVYSIGNEIFNESRVWLEGVRQNRLNISQEYYENAWIPTRPSETAISYNGYGRENVSSYYVEDGSYLRLQTATLGYTLPKNALEALNVKKIRFYVNANNIFTWTNYSGPDPEVTGPQALNGYDRFGYPKPFTFTVGLNMNF